MFFVKKAIASKSRGPLTSAFQAALKAEQIEEREPPRFRPSSFPICSIHVWQQMMQYKTFGFVPTPKTIYSDFFLQIGTTAHSVFQHWMATNGNIWGHWKCTNVSCASYNNVSKFSKKHLCPSCGAQRSYVELEVSHRGLVGHIDGIMEIRNRVFVPFDYKTASVHKLASGKTPTLANYFQLLVYAYILIEEYGLTVDGFSLLYITRDNPNNFTEHFFPMTKDRLREGKSRFELERTKFRAGMAAVKHNDISLAIAAKPCKSVTEYHAQQHVYTECPLLNVCFSRTKLETTLNKFSSSLVKTTSLL